MDLLKIYPKPIDNFVLWSSLFFFFIFFLWVVLGKIASKENTYTALNKAHFQVGIFYVLTSLLFIFWRFPNDLIYSLGSLFVGLFCYFTYHYVFFLSLIGLSKKSISANILTVIKSTSGKCQIQDLFKSYGDGKGFSFVKQDRLKQMVFLNFANEENGEYKITPRGEIIDSFGRLILRIWNFKRL